MKKPREYQEKVKSQPRELRVIQAWKASKNLEETKKKEEK